MADVQNSTPEPQPDVEADTAGRASDASESSELPRNRTPEALRALAEAAERRSKMAELWPNEHGGRGGLDPIRYGDWEKNGLAVDF